MAHRTLELTLISAQDLKDVNLFSKMEVYAVASIAGDHRSQQRTPADRHNGKNPAWNTTLRFSLPANTDLSRHVLHVLLRSERSLGDRDVGEVHIPLKELLEGPAAGKGPSTFVSYQVRKPSSGKAMGVLNLSYKFVDSAAPPAYPAAAPTYPTYEEPMKAKPTAAAYPPPGAAYPPPAAKYNEPVTAYPAGPSNGYPPASAAPYPQQGYPGPPQQQGYGYPPQGYPPQGYPQQGGYGYPPPQPQGYGYQPQGYAQPPKKNKMGGMGGMGMGLGAGLLGGLLLGEVVSDIGDGGFDGGFDDGGFGF